MQIQCPKCQEWTDTDSGACQLCGAELTETFEMPEGDGPIDLDTMFIIGKLNDVQKILKYAPPDTKVILDGTEITIGELKNKTEYFEQHKVRAYLLSFVLVFGFFGLIILLNVTCC